MAATFRIEVVIDPAKAASGARRVRGELTKTEGAADKLRTTIRNTFAGIGVGLIVRELGQAADAYTNLQNRIRTVTTGEEELGRVTRELFQIANDTRAAFDATGEVYARTALAAKDLGISQQQTLEFTKSLNQAVALSGAAAEEARAGLIQLSQGLASGALRGDELRSVLEQLPVVADVIARSLGVTRGELRELGAQGKITSEIILTAFAEAREELDQRFAKSVPTIAQGFTVLRNNLVEYIGAADQASGVSAALSSAIIALADNVEVVATGVFILGLSAFPTLARGIGAAIAQMQVAQSIAASGALFNPIIAGTAAAGAAVLLFVDLYADGLQRAVRETAALDKQLLDLARGGDLGAVTTAMTNVENSLRRVQEAAAEGLLSPEDAAPKIEALTAKLDELGQEWLALSDGTGRSLEEIRKHDDASDKLRRTVDGAIEAIGKENELLKENARERSIQVALLQEVAAIERQTGEGSVTDTQREALEAAIRGNAALAHRAEVLERVNGPQAEFEADLRVLKDLLAEEAISLPQFNAAVADLTSNLEGIDLSTLDLGEGAFNVDALKAAIAAAKEFGETTKETAADSIEALQEEQAALILMSQGREREAELLKITNDLKRQGIEATPEDAERIATLNSQNDALGLRVQLLQQITGPQQLYEQTESALNALQAQGSITAAQYTAALEDAARARDGVNATAATMIASLEREQEELALLAAGRIREAELLRITNELKAQGIAATPEEVERIANLNAENDALAARAELLQSIVGPQQEYNATLESLNLFLANGLINAEQYAAALKDAARASGQLAEETTPAQKAVGEALAGSFRAAENALVGFVRTGEFEFKEFVDSLLDEIARLLVRQALFAAFGSPASGGAAATAGFLGNFFGAEPRAEGGEFTGSTPLLVGEDGPEIITPRGSGEVIPAGETAARMAGGKQAAPIVNVAAPNVNITNVTDPNEIPRGIESEEGTEAILNVVARNKRKMKGAIA